jgi:bifunctional non-homologous end joining protein LigD
MVVDLPYLNGYDLRKLPLVRRRSRLKKLIAKTAIQFSESFAVDGPEMCKDACSAWLEGWPQRSATAAFRPARQ